MMMQTILPLLCLGASASCVSAADWVRGALFIPGLPDGVFISCSGEDALKADACPAYYPGQAQVVAPGRDEVFIKVSNGIDLSFSGPGEFGFERLEQIRPSGEEASRSRTIIGLRSGNLLLDSRQLNDESFLIVELPMGRLHVERALFSIDIRFDERSEIYDFRIVSADGVVRFSDHQGAQYYANEAQMLSGAGTSYAPSLEISDITRRVREHFIDYEARSQTVFAGEEIDLGFAEVYAPIQTAERGVIEAPVSDAGEDPIVIEYLPHPRPLVPHQAKSGLISAAYAKFLLRTKEPAAE
ncbi:hypothetical protein [Coraliomargarita akajimensis]|nr:hypothetical protein [Coraliomargarita akajimensis]